ncbi:MAG: hypothetical protein WC511_02420 [Candidatus Pacearchaeota archaeon]
MKEKNYCAVCSKSNPQSVEILTDSYFDGHRTERDYYKTFLCSGCKTQMEKEYSSGKPLESLGEEKGSDVVSRIQTRIRENVKQRVFARRARGVHCCGKMNLFCEKNKIYIRKDYKILGESITHCPFCGTYLKIS